MTHEERCLEILSDREWHKGLEFRGPETGDAGLSRVRALRSKGYKIECRRSSDMVTTPEGKRRRTEQREYRLAECPCDLDAPCFAEIASNFFRDHPMPLTHGLITNISKPSVRDFFDPCAVELES